MLRMPANDYGLHLLRDTPKKNSASAFTAINGRSSSLSSHNLTEPECVKTWDSVPREPGFRPISDFTDPTTLAGDRSYDNSSKRKRSLSIETEHLRGSLGKGDVLAKPSLTISYVEQKTTLKPYHRVLPTRETSCPKHHFNADFQDYERSQGLKPGTLELPYANVPLVRKGTPSERIGSASYKIGADQRCNQRRAGKRRQFANRTKTGCGTCRRRKKKCDEAKPECVNCLRGNFVRVGYTEPVPWSKNNAAHAPSVTQSQQRTSSAQVPAHIVGCPVCNVIHIPQCEPSQKICVEPTASSGIITSRDRPVCTDEQGRKPSTPSLWYKTCVEPQQHAHPPLARPRSHCRAAERHTQQSASRTVLTSPIATTQPTKCVQLVPPAPPDEACPNNDDGCGSRFLPRSAPALAAPPASSFSHYTQPSLPLKSEKNKMLSGEPFLPNTAQLVDERELALQASFRFNTALQKDSGERGWLFKRLAAAEWIYPRAGDCRVTGHLGLNINVSPPFHCDYGYNLSIGDNAIIGPGCQLLDSGKIVIGRNTKIGAGVTISTLEEPTDARSLEGSERTETAREVFIGENVYIGDGCIIGAGVRIGNNAVVRAGTVVGQASSHSSSCFRASDDRASTTSASQRMDKKDIPADYVGFGRPAKVEQFDWGSCW